MKESFYNMYVKYDGYNLLYNAFCDSYLILKDNIYSIFDKYRNNINSLSKHNNHLFEILKNNGFIVDSSIDEKKQVIYERIKRKFAGNVYHVIINPTLECNLSCWYCYEKQIPNSKISDEILDSIKKHIELKYSEEPFSELILSFFGGEPLLNIYSVIELLDFFKKFTNLHNIKLAVYFTSNGTLISDKLLNCLSDCTTSFQITLDGDSESHNKVRHFKINKKSTYLVIIKNLKKIQEKLTDYHISIRINYNAKTLKKIDKITNDLNFLNSKKISFGLQKVWQVKNEAISKNDLLNAIEVIFNKGYLVNYNPLNRNSYNCYADNQNCLLINFDGKIFKCTARNFESEQSVGKLNNDGSILWNYEKLFDRLLLEIPEKCKKCKLLPSCKGICLQNILEKKDACWLEFIDFTIEEYLAYNFKRNMLEQKIMTQ